MHAFKQTTTRRFDFGSLDKIAIKGREFRWISSNGFGHVLEPVLSNGQPITEIFSKSSTT